MTETPAKDVADLLQPVLVDLLALSLNLKQAHWLLRGKTFTQVHLQLDDVIADARDQADEVAERVVTLGGEVDGRPRTVAESTTLPVFTPGFVDVDAAIDGVIEQLDAAIATARKTLDPLDAMDPVSQDVVIELLRKLDKHRWMFRAQHP